MMARRRGRVTGKIWAIRAGIAIGSGILLGFIIGAITVRVVQPPGVISSVSENRSTRKPQPDVEPTDNEPAQQEQTPQVNGTLVPKLIGMEEGDARNAISRAGFSVGSVTFKASAKPLGTVVESIPVPGEALVLPATVSIILSDGKGRTDSLPSSSLR
ncbi:MAG: PASTA domain-containing protein [Phycisphaerae bacterium]|nr:PASTA domain-containing protein [Gemmatimonadaceae bacterium]